MNYYFAPMEGVTTWIYRQIHAQIYGPLDKYFIPFVEPHEKRDFKTRELKEILPEHNEGIKAIPQILTNRAEGFIKLARALEQMGYTEINLNLGCPSKTVVSRKKGSGFLAFPEELDHFLEEIFSSLDIKISVKTRLGKDSPEEFPRLLEIFNKYPLEELIVHPRVQADYYQNEPNLDAYRYAGNNSRNSLCYNGDLFTRTRIRTFEEEFAREDRLMIGRGLILNPGLVSGQNTKEQFRRFHDTLCQKYSEQDEGEKNVLFKMKELWFYQIHLFPDSDRYAKRLRKVQTLPEYRQIVNALLQERELLPPP